MRVRFGVLPPTGADDGPPQPHDVVMVCPPRDPVWVVPSGCFDIGDMGAHVDIETVAVTLGAVALGAVLSEGRSVLDEHRREGRQ